MVRCSGLIEKQDEFSDQLEAAAWLSVGTLPVKHSEGRTGRQRLQSEDNSAAQVNAAQPGVLKVEKRKTCARKNGKKC